MHLRLTNRNTEFFRLSQSDWRAVGLNVRMWKIEHLLLFNFALNWTFLFSSSFSYKIAFEQRNVCFRGSRTPPEFSCGSTKQGNYCQSTKINFKTHECSMLYDPPCFIMSAYPFFHYFQDQGCLAGLVLFLDNEDVNVVVTALEVCISFISLMSAKKNFIK